ncbi:MAG: hypothetical protein GEU75_12165 [Dehalococcoidia bacterium]|nr:hypothetical protein [Dehalococcoidia bacterium]
MTDSREDEPVTHEIELTAEDVAYLEPILAGLTQRAHFDEPFTLDYVLNYWGDFITDLENEQAGGMDEYINDVMLREIIEHDLLQNAPIALRIKLLTAIEPWDERFEAATQQLDKPIRYLPEGYEGHWWWYRAPKDVVVQWVENEEPPASKETPPEAAGPSTQ